MSGVLARFPLLLPVRNSCHTPSLRDAPGFFGLDVRPATDTHPNFVSRKPRFVPHLYPFVDESKGCSFKARDFEFVQ